MVGWVIWEQIDGVNDPKRQQPVTMKEWYIKFISIEIAFEKVLSYFYKLYILIYSFSYDGSFSVFFYAYASPFYDAFFFYHKAYFRIFFKLIY